MLIVFELPVPAGGSEWQVSLGPGYHGARVRRSDAEGPAARRGAAQTAATAVTAPAGRPVGLPGHCLPCRRCRARARSESEPGSYRSKQLAGSRSGPVTSQPEPQPERHAGWCVCACARAHAAQLPSTTQASVHLEPRASAASEGSGRT